MEYICLNNRKNIVCNLKAQPSPLQKGERRGKEGAKFLAYKDITLPLVDIGQPNLLYFYIIWNMCVYCNFVYFSQSQSQHYTTSQHYNITLQHTTIKYMTESDNTVHYNMSQYSSIQYTTIQYSIVHYNTVQYSIMHYHTIKHSTVHYCILHYHTNFFSWFLLYLCG